MNKHGSVNTFFEQTFKNGRKVVMPNTPIVFNETRNKVKEAPSLGKDSQAILQSLGYSEEDVKAFIEKGVVKVQ